MTEKTADASQKTENVVLQLVLCREKGMWCGMTTTELIQLLRKYEFGGATGRPRTVYVCVGDEIYDTEIESIGCGDGLFTELFLHLREEVGGADE